MSSITPATPVIYVIVFVFVLSHILITLIINIGSGLRDLAAAPPYIPKNEYFKQFWSSVSPIIQWLTWLFTNKEAVTVMLFLDMVLILLTMYKLLKG